MEESTNLGNSSTACPMLVAISPLESQPCFVSLLASSLAHFFSDTGRKSEDRYSVLPAVT